MKVRGIKKVSVSAIIILLILILAVSCNEQDKGGGTVTDRGSVTVSSDTDDNSQSDKALEIKKENGEFNITVIRPDNDDTSSKSVKAAQKICSAFENLTGIPCRLSSDILPSGADNDEPEILVGVP